MKRVITPVLAAWLLAAAVGSGCSTPGASGVSRANGETPGRLSEEEFEARVKSAAHYGVGIIRDLRDETDQANLEFWQAAMANPAYEPLVVDASRRLLRAEETDKALELLKKATRLKEAPSSYFALLGTAYSQKGDLKAAVEASETAIKKAPEALTPYQNLVQIYLQTSKTNDAVQVLHRASEAPGLDADSLVALVELYVRFGRLNIITQKVMRERMELALARAVDLAPEHPYTRLRLADHLLTLGDKNRAEGIYQELFEEYPDFPTLREKMAEILVRSQRYSEAYEVVKSLAEDHPTNPRTYLFLATLAMQQEKPREAEEHLERALLLNPDQEEVYYELAGIKVSQDEPREALDLLFKAQEKFSSTFTGEFYSGVARIMLKEFSKAVHHFTSAEIQAKVSEPERLTQHFYFQFGSAYERAGQHEEAARQFRKALDISPDFAEAQNYLGYMWADLGIHLEEARELIEKAVATEPDNAAFLDSLGWVLFKLGQPKEALDYMLQAVEKSDEPDPVLFDHLGDIYAALKNFDLARDAWEKALSLEPAEQTDQIREKIEKMSAGASR